jgi:hypothetical protein
MKLSLRDDDSAEKAYQLRKRVFKTVNTLLLWLSLANFIVIIYDLGFRHSPEVVSLLGSFYSASLVVSCVALGSRLLLLPRNAITKGARVAEYTLFAFQCVAIVGRFLLRGWLAAHAPFARTLFLIYLLFIAVFFIELSKISLSFYRIRFSPALLYLVSFLALIVFGAGLLLLPNATPRGISLVDALFTATSAVCVTGLAVVDTATHFTGTGKAIILLLIQVGGLGVMTLTSFFGSFFQGAYSYQQQIFHQGVCQRRQDRPDFPDPLQDHLRHPADRVAGGRLHLPVAGRPAFCHPHRPGAVCRVSRRVGLLQRGFFHPQRRPLRPSPPGAVRPATGDRLAGHPGRHRLPGDFQPVPNRPALPARQDGPLLHQPPSPEWPAGKPGLHVNTRLILVTTAILLGLGTVLFYVTERTGVLAGRSGYGQLVTAFFGSVTPRTAGFNTVDMEALSRPTILFYLLFMWIGASPGSTGGGIKTTTFAIAVLNSFSIARSKYRLEVFRREIPSESVRRAFAVMLLSFLVIGLAVFMVCLFDPGQDLIRVAFECFSAYATVGLSLNVTPELSDASKAVIMITMYLGRVGTLTLLVALTRTVGSLSYRYPSETVFIS